MAFVLSNIISTCLNTSLTCSLLTGSPLSNRLRSLHHRPSHPHCRITASSDVQLQQSKNLDLPASVSTASWSEFATNVSGEWDGFGADFTKEGKPVELPFNVVPDAYREWEVKVFDWQTQCPTLAQPEHDHDPQLFYKLIKLLPTVGCEADAATRYTIEQRNIGGADSQVSVFAYQSSGCYVAVCPPIKGDNKKFMELEHCLVDPRNHESRVRIIQVVSVNGSNSKLELRDIKVFCEQYYGPFRNGDQLGGCAIRDSAFASTPALKGSEVAGVWQQTRNSIARFNTNMIEELVKDSEQNVVTRDESHVIMLPRQLWCSLKETENGETCSEVGWIYDQGVAITSRCVFSTDAKLKEIVVACESASLEKL